MSNLVAVFQIPVAGLIGTAMVVAVVGASSCAARRPGAQDYGDPRCAVAAADGLLSPSALQCWFDAEHGRWRTLSHESHYDVLVVRVEAANLGDADEIAHRFVTGLAGTFSEILVYTQAEGPPVSSRIRRVGWTRDTGFESLDFTAPAAPN